MSEAQSEDASVKAGSVYMAVVGKQFLLLGISYFFLNNNNK